MYLKNSYFEYCFYICYNGGCPYYSNIFYSLEEALLWLKSIEKKAIRYNQIFYVDNDFYNNHYNKEVSKYGVYYKLLVRPTNNWKTF